MATMELVKKDAVYVLTLTNGANANTMNADVIGEYVKIFDELEATTENAALVVTSNDPKFWCNGIDLKWLLTKSPDYFTEFAALVERLFLRCALLNIPTVGCLTGHTYAGGALLAVTFDFRLMREDRGFFCFPEVDINIPFTPVMYEILKLLPDHYSLNELLLTGRRVGGGEAQAMKIVSAAYPQEILFEKAMELATILAKKDRKTYVSIKHGLRKHLLKFIPSGHTS
jgi:enoyl-CoA hydratase/carnithine racemase